MDIQKLIKENYEIAKSKGFYPDDSKIEDHLMGIVSELGEAYEAHRGGKFAFCNTNLGGFDQSDWDDLKGDKEYFETMVKDSYEDELADVSIRIMNLSVFKNKRALELKHIGLEQFENKDVSDVLLLINRFSISQNLNMAISYLFSYCEFANIPIEKHIQAKMEYNKTREHLHGKEY